MIKAFEYTYELAWTTLKDFLEYQGHAGIYGSRDVIRKAIDLQVLNKISRDLDDQLIPNAIDLCVYYNIDDSDVLEHIQGVGKIVYSREMHGG